MEFTVSLEFKISSQRFLQFCLKQSSVPPAKMSLRALRLSVYTWLLSQIHKDKWWQDAFPDMPCQMRALWSHPCNPAIINGPILPDIILRSSQDNKGPGKQNRVTRNAFLSSFLWREQLSLHHQDVSSSLETEAVIRAYICRWQWPHKPLLSVLEASVHAD